MAEQIGNAEHMERKLEIINADVTNHCNARCFFCFNDWDAFKPHNMTMETFRNLLKLLPLMGGSDFLVSCWFEPTIHPAFYDMLDLLPAEFKEKVYFTTNLVTEISEENMERMCRANVDHINISLETFDMDEYSSITGVKKTHFFDNIEKLAVCSKKYGTNLHVITMLTRRNAKHFKELVKRTQELLAPSLHEIRTPYFFIEDTGTKETLIKDLLTRREIEEIRRDVETLGYEHLWWEVRFSREVFEELEQNPQPHIESSNKIYYRLRVNSDGTAHLGHQKTGTRIDINEPGDIVLKVKQEIGRLQEQEVSMNRLDTQGMRLRKKPIQKPCWLDAVRIYDDRFLFLRGWDLSAAYPVRHGLTQVAVLECRNKRIVMRLQKENRPDVAEAMHSSESARAGFSVLFDLKECGNSRYTVSTGFIKDNEIILTRELYASREALKDKARKLAHLADPIKRRGQS